MESDYVLPAKMCFVQHIGRRNLWKAEPTIFLTSLRAYCVAVRLKLQSQVFISADTKCDRFLAPMAMDACLSTVTASPTGYITLALLIG